MRDVQKTDAITAAFVESCSTWLDELGLVADMAANCERTGVAPDQRSGQRASALLSELSKFHEEVSNLNPDVPSKAAQARVLKAAIQTLCNEAQAAAAQLRAEA